MTKPAHVIEIFLQPGELYFGDENSRIRTLLGSCVSVTIWHPQLRVGGMCHYMLPMRGRTRGGHLDGRYADEAIELLVREAQRIGTRPSEYEAKLFGGGDMFPGRARSSCREHSKGTCSETGCRQISCKNAWAGRDLLERAGFPVVAENLGGPIHRFVIFDIWSGSVWVRQSRIDAIDPRSSERAC